MHATGQDPWLQLRRLRGRIPMLVPAEAGEAFSAAIEQSEAYHRAAMTAGPAVSPTLLYYSLVQLGKAMHFAAGMSPGSLPGKHGVAGDKPKRVDDPPATYPKPLRNQRGELPPVDEGDDEPDEDHEGGQEPDAIEPIDRRMFARTVRSFTGPDSTFSHVQNLLGEEEVALNTSLGRLLSGHPDCADLFIDLGDDRPIAIRALPDAGFDFVRRLASRGLVLQVIYGPYELGDDELVERFRQIPFPDGWEPIAEGGGVKVGARSFLHHIQWRPQPIRHEGQPGIIDYSGSPMHFGEVSWLGAAGMDPDESGFVTVPPNAPTDARWSRLTWWWVILHALSDVARYHPAEWAEAIDLRRSPIAADLDEMLARAARLLPNLGYWAIQRGEASQKPPPLEHALT